MPTRIVYVVLRETLDIHIGKLMRLISHCGKIALFLLSQSCNFEHRDGNFTSRYHIRNNSRNGHHEEYYTQEKEIICER